MYSCKIGKQSIWWDLCIDHSYEVISITAHEQGMEKDMTYLLA